MQRELDKEFRENYYCEVYALQVSGACRCGGASLGPVADRSPRLRPPPHLGRLWQIRIFELPQDFDAAIQVRDRPLGAAWRL